MSSPLLPATRVVLIRPSLPENVGAIARGMRHFGLQQLIVVGGVSPTHSLALAAGAGSDDILAAARVVDDLEAALDGCVLALGTTARPQNNVERRAISPAEGARIAATHAAAHPCRAHGQQAVDRARSSTSVALVFGTEKHGMSVEELRRCHQIVTIPGEAEACLNLAQAFTVLAYEWRLAAQQPPAGATPLTAVPGLAEAIAGALTAAGVLKARDRASKLHTLRRVLSSTPLSADEAAMLQGLARGYQQSRQYDNQDITSP